MPIGLNIFGKNSQSVCSEMTFGPNATNYHLELCFTLKKSIWWSCPTWKIVQRKQILFYVTNCDQIIKRI